MKRYIDMMNVAAGQYVPQWSRSVRMTVVGATLNAVAIVMLLPLTHALIEGHQQRALWLVVVLAGLLAAETAVRAGELGFAYTLYPELLQDTRLRLGEQLRAVPAEELGQRRSGELSVVLNSDVTNAMLAVSDAASIFLRLIVLPSGLTVALAVIDWRLLLGTMVGAAIAAIAAISLARQNSAMAAGQREIGAADAETADRVVEYVQDLPVLKAAGQVGERSERLVGAMEAQGNALNAMMSRMTSSLTGAAIGANLAVAGVVAVVIAAVNGLTFIAGPLAGAAVYEIDPAAPFLTGAAASLAAWVFTLAHPTLRAGVRDA